MRKGGGGLVVLHHDEMLKMAVTQKPRKASGSSWETGARGGITMESTLLSLGLLRGMRRWVLTVAINKSDCCRRREKIKPQKKKVKIN